MAKKPQATSQPKSNDKEKSNMALELDMNTIQGLLASGRERGVYDDEIDEFLASGIAGVEIDLANGRFASKKASNVKTGLDNAKARVVKDTNEPVHPGGHNLVVRVVGKEGDEKNPQRVFLINKALVEGAAA